MIPTYVKRTLALNVRHFRSELNLSQEALAEKAGLSLRIIQDVEKARANPSLETIVAIAAGLRVLHQRLLSLHHLKLADVSHGEFEASFRNAFQSKPYGVSMRDLEGAIRWANEKCSKISGCDLSNGNNAWLDTLDPDSRAIMRNQLKAERQGIVYPYTINISNQVHGERNHYRYHPTLVIESGNDSFITSFITEIDLDCEVNYFDYCGSLLKAAGVGKE